MAGEGGVGLGVAGGYEHILDLCKMCRMCRLSEKLNYY